MNKTYQKWLEEEAPFNPSKETCFIGGYNLAVEEVKEKIESLEECPYPKVKAILAYLKDYIDNLTKN